MAQIDAMAFLVISPGRPRTGQDRRDGAEKSGEKRGARHPTPHPILPAAPRRSSPLSHRSW